MSLFFLIVALFFASPLQAKDTPSSDKVWVVVRPVQCLGNGWEKEWLAKNKNQGGQFPRAEEFSMVKKYFARKSVPILELRVQSFMAGEMRCQTCDCPRGDTLYLLIHSDNAPRMAQLGYAERLPAKDIPLKK